MKIPSVLPLKLNIRFTPFKSANYVAKPTVFPIKDGFTTNPLYEKLGTKTSIEASAVSNPRILEILKEHNLPLKVNTGVLEKLKEGHLKDTRIISVKIYSSLPEDLKKQVNLSDLQEAAMLHDYGKVLIPTQILNKRGRLDAKEHAIMELHSELGYELLKNKGLSDGTLKLIKYHHQNKNGTGYPGIKSDFENSIENQILSVADKYTALREKRSYKNPFSKYEALEILAKEVNDGNISQEVYNALVKAV